MERIPSAMITILRQFQGNIVFDFRNNEYILNRNKRKGYKEHPRTPDPYEASSKRMFDGQIKAW